MPASTEAPAANDDDRPAEPAKAAAARAIVLMFGCLKRRVCSVKGGRERERERVLEGVCEGGVKTGTGWISNHPEIGRIIFVSP